MTLTEKIAILKQDGFVSAYVDECSMGLDNKDLNIRAIIYISTDYVIFLRHYDFGGKRIAVRLSVHDHFLLESIKYQLINKDLDYGFHEIKNRRD